MCSLQANDFMDKRILFCTKVSVTIGETMATVHVPRIVDMATTRTRTIVLRQNMGNCCFLNRAFVHEPIHHIHVVHNQCHVMVVYIPSVECLCLSV